MLVCDMTSRKTFDNIDRWIRNIQSLAAEDVEMLIIANKCDIEDRRVVSEEEIVELSKDRKVITNTNR